MVARLTDALRKLETYKNVDYPILSIYLNLPESPKLHDKNSLHSQFHMLIKKNVKPEDRKGLKNELEYIDAFLATRQTLNHNSRGAALFAGGNRLWEVVTTPFPLKPQLFIEHRPHLDLLRQNLDEYKRYLVVLTDRQKAKFFTITLGKVEAHEEVFDNSVPQNVKANEVQYYGRSNKIARHIQDHLHRHMKLIANRLEHFVNGKPIAGVIVGGHSTLIHKTEEYLPKSLKKQVIAEFITELNDSLKSIAEKSLKIIHEVNPQEPRMAY